VERNKDSERLISLIFGTDIHVHTAREKTFIVDSLTTETEVKRIAQGQIDKDSDCLQILPHERPDLLVISRNHVLAIEHFEVDSSKRTKNGSSYRQVYNDRHFLSRQRDIDKRLETERIVVSTEKIETRFCYTNLLENTKDFFDQHYAKIESYRNEISAYEGMKNRQIEVIFYVEYAIMFPSFFVAESGPMTVVFPHNDIEFINYLRSKDRVSGVLFHFDSGSAKLPSVNQFILISPDNLDEYKVNDAYVFDLSTKLVHDFENPIMNSASFVVPYET
jgi:hypothetical protein